MRKTIALLLTCTITCCSTGTPAPGEHQPVPDPTMARLDSFLLRCTDNGFNGSALVLRDGHALLDRGYGLRDRENRLPNTPATVHAIGSITKQFTAACVLKLQEAGRLKVSDPMNKYLDGVPMDKSGITLHHLLTHSAGFPGAIGDDNDAIDDVAFTRLALRTPLAFEPGTGYNYSNVGYSLLGIIVEHVSGMAYEHYLHDSLLVPAGVLRTGFGVPDWTKEELAIGYRKDNTRWGTMLDHPTVSGGPGWHLRANGGLLSTTHDMASWLDALRNNKVLSKSSTDVLFAPHVEEGEDAGSHYGYGWAIFQTPRGTRLITHNGGNGVQFADVLWYADEGIVVVLMSNASIRGMNDLAWQLGRMVVDTGFRPEVPRPAIAMSGPPDGPIGDRMRSLAAIIGSTGELEEWLNENLGPGFYADVPLEQHLAAFQRMRKDIGPNDLGNIERLSDEEFVLELVSRATGKRFRVRLQLRPTDARISGLGVEEV